MEVTDRLPLEKNTVLQFVITRREAYDLENDTAPLEGFEDTAGAFEHIGANPAHSVGYSSRHAAERYGRIEDG